MSVSMALPAHDHRYERAGDAVHSRNILQGHRFSHLANAYGVIESQSSAPMLKRRRSGGHFTLGPCLTPIYEANHGLCNSITSCNLTLRHLACKSTNIGNLLWGQLGHGAAPHVDRVRYSLQVARIYTQTITAPVVNFKTVSDWAIGLLIEPAVGRHGAAVLPCKCIPLAVFGALPNPTTGFRIHEIVVHTPSLSWVNCTRRQEGA